MELASKYQWFGDVSLDTRVFMTLENNFDLFAELDLQRYSNVLVALSDFFSSKRRLVEQDHKTGSYDTYFQYISDSFVFLRFFYFLLFQQMLEIICLPI